MADAVSSKVLFESPTKLIMQFINLSDGTGESGVVKVDKSAYTCVNGLEPTSLRVDRIHGDATGMEVLIYCDRTTDINIARVGGLGEFDYDYRETGGFETNTAGDTGDILFTTAGHTTNDSYNIIIEMRKKE